ncbi:MAG TPA: hypothetical protein VEJ36_07455 [Nitrososphaerales archaeon]|nr:hypothetical protein [Nitrososphaerales archaeon]
MVASELVVVGSFLLAFKAVLLEGSEVAILSVATVKQLGRDNVLFGVIAGGLVSLFLFLAVRQLFVLLPEIAIDVATAAVLYYFSFRFLRAFRRYYFGKRSFRDKMARLEAEVVEKGMRKVDERPEETPPFSVASSAPVFAITLTEGFEASLVLAAAGAFDFDWTMIGALTSISVLVAICAVSYDYLLRVPRWALDIIAGSVLFTFATVFLVTGLLSSL